MRIKPTATLLLVSAALSGCGPASGVMLIGDVVNAAASAAVDADKAHAHRVAKAERDEGLQTYLIETDARAGKPVAEYRMALLQLQHDNPAALDWMCKSAAQGYGPAQLNLGHWYNEDRRQQDLWPFISVSLDNRVAYMWYTLAAEHGVPFATQYRDNLVAAGMSRQDIAEAKAMAAAWRPGSCHERSPGWHGPERLAGRR